MRPTDTLQAASRALLANANRTALTMVGIIIGVASVVLMVSIGATFERYIVDQVESFGTNTMDVMPTGFEKFGSSLDGISFDDYEAISRLPSVERAVPVILVSKPVRRANEEVSPMVLGSYGEIFGNYGLTLNKGRLLDDADDRGAKAVAVLGSKTRDDLFGSRTAVGSRITIGDASFTVVGTLESMGSFLLQDLDALVFIPFSSARAMTGQRHVSYVTLKTVGDPSMAKDDITQLLRRRHNIENPENDPDKDDFIARSAEQVTETIGVVTMGLTVFLSLIAGISLLVGGIGIMNILLVSVTERTREIGLRKAVGARRRDILLQFLSEALVLTCSGGFIGLALGAFGGWFLTQLAARFLGELSFVLSLNAVLLALAMAFGTGLVFGIYPARKAAMLSPMEALRFE